jgi:hypothetical protein
MFLMYDTYRTNQKTVVRKATGGEPRASIGLNKIRSLFQSFHTNPQAPRRNARAHDACHDPSPTGIV